MGYGLLFWHEDDDHPDYRDDVLVKGLSPREHTYTGLQHDATYKFRIHACNETPACGWWTNPPLEVTTERAPTPQRPHTITFAQISSDSARVRWSAAANTGGVPLTGFDLRYWPYDPDNPDEESGAIDHPADDGNDRGETLKDLAAGTEYELKLRACNGPKDSHCSNWSDDHRFTTTGGTTPNATVPTNLDVIPLADRRARVTWSPATGATGYVVQVRRVGSTSEEDWQPSRGIFFHIGAGSSIRHGLDFYLDTFVTGGLAAHAGNQLQVRAITGRDDQGHDVLSEPSETIVIMDTPIRTVNGDSREVSNGKAVVTWVPVETILGDPYAQGSYRFRYRRIGGDHTMLSWRPGTAGVGTAHETPIVPAGSTSYPIEDHLLRHQIYAIQLRYEIELDSDVSDAATKVFAARDAYVWTSERAAGGGERVATFPLNYPLENTNYVNRATYAYRLCDDTFPELILNGPDRNRDHRRVEWSEFIFHAFDQWRAATNGVVVVTHEEGPCAKYSALVQQVTSAVSVMQGSGPAGQGDTKDLDSHVEALLDRFRHLGVLRNAVLRAAIATDGDQVGNEVFMYDTSDRPMVLEFGAELAPGPCSDDALGCAPRRGVRHPTKGWIVDIVLRKHNLYEPDEGLFIPELPTVAFNTCRPVIPGNTVGTRFTSAYSTLVHELGHALGIREGTEGRDDAVHHPSDGLGDSVMVTKSLFCAPAPHDVLAINAVYQTR